MGAPGAAVKGSYLDVASRHVSRVKYGPSLIWWRFVVLVSVSSRGSPRDTTNTRKELQLLGYTLVITFRLALAFSVLVTLALPGRIKVSFNDRLTSYLMLLRILELL